jgi:hypothetical protein
VRRRHHYPGIVIVQRRRHSSVRWKFSRCMEEAVRCRIGRVQPTCVSCIAGLETDNTSHYRFNRQFWDAEEGYSIRFYKAFLNKSAHTYLHMAQFSKHSFPTRKVSSWSRPDNMT